MRSGFPGHGDLQKLLELKYSPYPMAWIGCFAVFVSFELFQARFPQAKAPAVIMPAGALLHPHWQVEASGAGSFFARCRSVRRNPSRERGV